MIDVLQHINYQQDSLLPRRDRNHTTTILVLGATGKAGRNLVPALLSRQVEVRAATRNSEAFDGTSNATVVRFDWNDRQTCSAALDGADGVYLIKPESESATDLVSEFLAEMTRAGASRLVLHSEDAAKTRSATDEERRVELVVEQSEFDWTIIRPNWFIQDLDDQYFFGGMIRDKGIIAMTTGGAGVSWIDSRDIAATAVELLCDPSLCRNEAFTLSGPEALTIEALTNRIRSITGHHVVPVEETIDAAEVRMRRDGLPEDLIAYLKRLNASIIAGDTATVTDSVERVTGRPPRSIDNFLAEWAPQLAAQTENVSRAVVKANEALFGRQIKAWAGNDIDSLLECYNNDIVYVDVPFPDQPVRGLDAFRAHMINYNGQFDRSDFVAEIITLVANETHVVGELFCTGRYIGTGSPEGGVIISWSATLVETVVEGKICSERAYFDPTIFEKAVVKASC
ncbi:NAD(P)H-binding protein [Glutamicibacter nicotianae]|uniref:NAD(P)-binding domain-containing protein n=1 Tax=Glutamicibacter nicotianae TaxID=37929 RepID=A0ABQ0RRF7_GLUNI|nr:NAD(P)H-binding protein [Glutamicibacter nicotianae]GEC14081.1 hypothetical protein ANI01nite_32840 [Glutamicibacter nicotianae]